MNKYKKNKLYTVVFLLFGILFIVYDLMLANVEFGFYCWIILTLIEIIVMIGCFIFCLYGIAQYYFELHEIKEFQKQKAMILKDIENIENEKKQYYEVIYNKQKDIFIEYYNLRTGVINYKDFLNTYNFDYLVVAFYENILFTYIDESKNYTLIYNENNKLKLYKKIEE